MNKDFNFEKHPWESFLFLDIETVARVKELEEDTPLYDSFMYKMRYAEEAQRKDFNSYNVKALFASKAALYPEFGKIVAITVGKIKNGKLNLITYKGHSEVELLKTFMGKLTEMIFETPDLAICGVNIKFFDLRFLYIRSVINQIKPIKGHISFTGFKPWEIKVADITDVWKQTSMYNAPLACMTECLGLPTPKSDIDGSQVSETYWKEGDSGLDRIASYCSRDVFAVANVAKKLRFEPVLEIGVDAIVDVDTGEQVIQRKAPTKAPTETPTKGKARKGKVTAPKLPPLLNKSFVMKEINKEGEAAILQRVKRSSKVERERVVQIVKAIYGKEATDDNFINQILTAK